MSPVRPRTDQEVVYKYFASIRNNQGKALYLSKLRTTDTLYMSGVDTDVQSFESLEEIVQCVYNYLATLTYGNPDIQIKYITFERVKVKNEIVEAYT